MKKEIEKIITGMLFRITIAKWHIPSSYSYEDFAEDNKGYVQYATRKIIKLIKESKE